MLSLWNTATRKVEPFVPLHPPKVGMYTCGPTVYWDAHIGNLRSYVFEDILLRTLRSEGYEVTRALNITDVGHLTDDADTGEDKMELAAAKSGASAWDIAKRYTERFVEDAKALNIVLPPSPLLCRATDHIQEQIDLVKRLEEKGFTYRTSDGVYFDTSKYPSYGSFSGQKLEDKEEGARVAVNPEKRNRSDFALWKFSPTGAKRQMEWDSPWGVGFPGWHLECSAMAHKYLGQPFDIHCGGIDHVPVHHENEIAQSEAAYGVKLARFWLHNEFLSVDGQKMSKSLGNVYTLTDVASRGIDPLALRLFYFGAHYRQKLNFTWEAVRGSQNALNRLRATARGWTGPGSVLADIEAEFKAALADDLNTPKAVAVLWKLVDGEAAVGDKAATLRAMDQVLGLSLDQVIGREVEVPAEVRALADERAVARVAKDWKRADELRERMEALGWTAEDGKEGQKVRPMA